MNQIPCGTLTTAPGSTAEFAVLMLLPFVVRSVKIGVAFCAKLNATLAAVGREFIFALRTTAPAGFCLNPRVPVQGSRRWPHRSLGGLAPEEYGRAMNEENQTGQSTNLRVVYSAG